MMLEGVVSHLASVARFYEIGNVCRHRKPPVMFLYPHKGFIGGLMA